MTTSINKSRNKHMIKNTSLDRTDRKTLRSPVATFNYCLPSPPPRSCTLPKQKPGLVKKGESRPIFPLARVCECQLEFRPNSGVMRFCPHASAEM